MTRIRARHVYGAAALLFVLVLSFQGIRLAAGDDPAGAATTPVRESAPPAATATPGTGGSGGWGSGAQRRERPRVVPDDPYGVDPGGQGVVPDDPYGVDPGGQGVVPDDPYDVGPDQQPTVPDDPSGPSWGGGSVPGETRDA